MVVTALSDVKLADCTKPLKADAGTRVVLPERRPHLSHEIRPVASYYAYALHLIDGDSIYLDENWLQRPVELPLRGF